LNLYRGDTPELYHLESDPGELQNLAHDPAQRSRIVQLAARLQDWQQRHGDSLPLHL
jgi:hypothetical protein